MTHSERVFRRLGCNRAFTVVELLVALSAAAIILGLSYQGYSFFLQNFKRWQDRVLIEANARRALDAMIQDFRTMRYLQVADPGAISFLDDKRRPINYTLDSQRLLRNNRSLLNFKVRATKLKFDYRGVGAGTHGPVSLPDVTSIGIELILAGANNMTFELVSSVNLRNKRVF